jgi:hypothetical protein
MSVSIDLANASHYDVHDASYGYSIWTEKKPGTATNWYFVLPNMIPLIKGNQTNGIAVKLSHGTIISWDGRIHRHCTSITNTGNQNHAYGWFWAADGRAIQHRSKMLEDVSDSEDEESEQDNQ